MRRGQNTKKFFLAIAIVGAFVLYSLIHNQSTAAPTTTNTGAGSGTAPTGTPAGNTSSGTAGAGASPTASGGSGSSGSGYKDGTYNGSVADAQWGYVQVQVVIKGGKMTAVNWLQYPNDRDRSILINQQADPMLTNEAIQAQSAQVDIVTGATDSSLAFIQSLSDALAKA